MRFTVRATRVLCLIALGAASKLSAQITVGVPDASGGGNSIPFGASIFGNEYQQVYTSLAFPSPFSITSIDFFHTITAPGAGFYAPGTYNVYFGTTSRAVTATDPIFANNETSPLLLFATLVIAPGTSAAGSTLSIAGTPFLYNPGAGNLLLDIQYTNTAGSVFLDFDRNANGVMSRAFGTGASGTVNNGVGLVTRFNGVSTPEPTTLVLGATGLVLIGGLARRRRRRAA